MQEFRFFFGKFSISHSRVTIERFSRNRVKLSTRVLLRRVFFNRALLFTLNRVGSDAVTGLPSFKLSMRTIRNEVSPPRNRNKCVHSTRSSFPIFTEEKWLPRSLLWEKRGTFLFLSRYLSTDFVPSKRKGNGKKVSIPVDLFPLYDRVLDVHFTLETSINRERSKSKSFPTRVSKGMIEEITRRIISVAMFRNASADAHPEIFRRRTSYRSGGLPSRVSRKPASKLITWLGNSPGKYFP